MFQKLGLQLYTVRNSMNDSDSIRQTLDAVKKAGYDGYASIEYEGAIDCIEGITIGFENLKRYISEIENGF